MEIETALTLMNMLNSIVLLLLGTMVYCIGWAIFNGIRTVRTWKRREREFYEETMTKFKSGEWRKIDDDSTT